jgi:integrase
LNGSLRADYLEFTRHNSARSRNVRLAAIRSFFRWVALCDPELAGLATRVLAIPAKRTDRRLVQSLSRAEVDAVLAAPDRSQWLGRRDHALLLTLNTPALVFQKSRRFSRRRFSSAAARSLAWKGKAARSEASRCGQLRPES